MSFQQKGIRFKCIELLERFSSFRVDLLSFQIPNEVALEYDMIYFRNIIIFGLYVGLSFVGKLILVL